MDLELADKVVLVGGGSRGLGRAAAEVFTREGCSVPLYARGGDELGPRRSRDHRGHEDGRRLRSRLT